MIRVSRGSEPPGLKTARKNRLPKATEAYNSAGPSSPELKGYGSAPTRETLYQAQHKKCAWCERRRDLSSSPVDHYRPKNGAWRHKRDEEVLVDAGHYWWLTWTWENLLFSCSRCNDQGHKGNFFPLSAGTAALSLPGRPVPTAAGVEPSFCSTQGEHPMLVDPATEDPLDHIDWCPIDDRLARVDWCWTPRAKTERGRATIWILKLDELADEANDHLVLTVLPTLDDLDRELDEGRNDDARERWSDLLCRVFAPACGFHALTYCALELWVPESKRQEFRLDPLRRPGSYHQKAPVS